MVYVSNGKIFVRFNRQIFIIRLSLRLEGLIPDILVEVKQLG